MLHWPSISPSVLSKICQGAPIIGHSWVPRCAIVPQWKQYTHMCLKFGICLVVTQLEYWLCWVVDHFLSPPSLATLSEDVADQREELEDVKEDVAVAVAQVEELDSRVDQTERDIEHVKEDVTKVEERLDDVEETVEDTLDKVEEIDNKVYSDGGRIQQ